ncbi:MAG TPA: hypothetical protein ENK05_06215 [Gammaproteobacteria bacterium]|nr:hypothetical protein [Gammaproteobacteria bacterium]
MKAVFIGNRFGVLEKMLVAGYERVDILAVPDSFLERALLSRSISYTPVENRKQLLDLLAELQFDLLVSNGCPYLLPVSGLDDGRRKFINVHPALLPEHRGPHAVNAALLYGYGAGASCHLMDDEADSGPVIARVEIPCSADLDLGLLYQLSFMAEAEAFDLALARGFRPMEPQPSNGDKSTYFRRGAGACRLDLDADPEKICRQVRAFGIASQGTEFVCAGRRYRVFDAEIIRNGYLRSKAPKYRENEVVLVYEDALVLKKGDGLIKLKSTPGKLQGIVPGMFLEQPPNSAS